MRLVEIPRSRAYNHDRMLKNLVRLSLLLTSFFLAADAWPSSETATNPKESRDWDVLLITVDTTRADRIGCYGYSLAATPHIDALAAEGVRFANAYSPVPLTLPSHCSILTGEYPFVHRVRNNGSYSLPPGRPTLAKVLKARGLSTSAFVASFTVDSRFGLAQGFDLYDDTFDRREALKSFRSERPADQVASAFLSWLRQNGQRRFFSWVHFFDPHLPYSPPPPFDRKFKGRPYDGEIAFVDQEIGRIIATLQESGLWDRTLVLLAGDHGEALGEKREIDHGLFIYESALRVPLILRAPGGLPKGATVKARVRLIDILPTILDLLKVKSPRDVSGQSLVPHILGRKTDDLPAYAETFYPRENYGWSELLGLVVGQWKYVFAPKPELYDLASDPREERNLVWEEAQRAASLSQNLKALIAGKSADEQVARRRVSPEEEARLRSLGYAGGTSDTKASGPLPDAKDKIEDYVIYFRGNLFGTRGEYDQAEICYQKVLASNPDVPWNYVNLGILLAKMDRSGDAIQILEEGRRRMPESSATILSRQKKWADAVSYFGRALKIEPENESLRGNYEQARAELQRNLR